MCDAMPFLASFIEGENVGVVDEDMWVGVVDEEFLK